MLCVRGKTRARAGNPTTYTVVWCNAEMFGIFSPLLLPRRTYVFDMTTLGKDLFQDEVGLKNSPVVRMTESSRRQESFPPESPTGERGRAEGGTFASHQPMCPLKAAQARLRRRRENGGAGQRVRRQHRDRGNEEGGSLTRSRDTFFSDPRSPYLASTA